MNKTKPLVIGVMTGVTALVGGIEPAEATLMVESYSDGFGLFDVQDEEVAGVFFNENTDTATLNLFNDMGGTRILQSVALVVETAETSMDVSATGTCQDEGGGACEVEVDNDTTFDVLDVTPTGGTSFAFLTPAQVMFNLEASDDCTPPFSSNCDLEAFNNLSPALGDFTLTIPSSSPADLLQFIGVGTFDVMTMLTLGGGVEFSVIQGSADFQENFAQANSMWGGTVNVTYEYKLAQVPEPGTLLLFTAGIAGLGLTSRRRNQR